MSTRPTARLLLWEEYRAANPDGFGYTWFCTTFEAWKQRVRPSMRQTHTGGAKVFVNFAGDTIDVFDPITGEAHAMELFVAAMGASNYTYAAACPSEGLPDWIGMHTSCSAFWAAYLRAKLFITPAAQTARSCQPRIKTTPRDTERLA